MLQVVMSVDLAETGGVVYEHTQTQEAWTDNTEEQKDRDCIFRFSIPFHFTLEAR